MPEWHSHFDGRYSKTIETPEWHSNFDGRRSKPIEMPALRCVEMSMEDEKKLAEIPTWHRHFE